MPLLLTLSNLPQCIKLAKLLLAILYLEIQFSLAGDRLKVVQGCNACCSSHLIVVLWPYISF